MIGAGDNASEAMLLHKSKADVNKWLLGGMCSLAIRLAIYGTLSRVPTKAE